MEIKPVKQAKKPKYPTLEYYIKNPELLSNSIPESWIKNKYVVLSLATFVLLGSPRSGGTVNPSATEIQDKIGPDQKGQVSVRDHDPVKIAPIFAHGDGSGATGCIVMSPPVFISEDEAREIIFNALSAEGIAFDTTDCPVIKFKALPIANDCFGDNDTTNVPDVNVEFRMDGYNKELNLAIQYVSADDYYKFRSDDGCWSSVQGFDTKRAAEIIRKELNANGKTNTVVFYDPMPSVNFEDNEGWEKSQKEAKKKASKQLLAQVTDFIKWIKKENFIPK